MVWRAHPNTKISNVFVIRLHQKAACSEEDGWHAELSSELYWHFTKRVKPSLHENKQGCVNFLVNSAIWEFLSMCAYFWFHITIPKRDWFLNQKCHKSWEFLAAPVGQKNRLTVPIKDFPQWLRFLVCLSTFLSSKSSGSVTFPPSYSQLDRERWQKHPSRASPWCSCLPCIISWCPTVCLCNSIILYKHKGLLDF